MNDPVYTLFRHAMDDDIYLKFMDDPDEYWSIRRVCSAALDRLAEQLNPALKRDLHIFIDEWVSADTIETEAAFTAGLSFGLHLLRLL